MTLLVGILLAWIAAVRAVAQPRSFLLTTVSPGRWRAIPEHFMYLAIVVLMGAVYLYAGFLSTSHWFGFGQLRHIGLPLTIGAFGLATVVAVRLNPALETSAFMAAFSRRVSERWFCVLLAVVFVAIASPLRTTVINPDGLMWRDHFMARRGPVMDVDELFESSVVMVLLWPARLGVTLDWNLYAPMSLCLIIWCAYDFLKVKFLRYKVAFALGLVMLGAAHTYAWIICNHVVSCSR